GADSLAAARVLSRLRARTTAGVGLEELFERRTIAGQAALLRRAAPPPAPAPESAAAHGGLSPAQMGMWLLDQVEPGSPAYCTAFRGGRPRPVPAAAPDGEPEPGRSAAGLGAQLAYWRRQLEGVPPLRPVPGARPRPALPSHAGDEVLATLDRGLAAAVDRLA